MAQDKITSTAEALHILRTAQPLTPKVRKQCERVLSRSAS